ncbi:DNA-binding protein [Sphingomonas koreensis]|uniref:DNA-binding protein n=2 Tax=Sphingomonadaceae TaxID=41297 RepID=A0A1L6J7V7_9SPHN|nr:MULTISPECIES: helix-turn-helix domain-containing protein [Pseudomonadota]MAF62117.1 DNA-binding protein [Blastomonas sp.]QEH77908.1 helix-turn-helix domain-containing protein [Sphingomonas sp. C8-2]APR52051.1 DNA-binding protein [Sphingomonas koreensis]MBF5091347.1 helix-turn-helix domain-containing protein [Novosphingobium sp. NBM11]MCE4542328.1 helix-turn-helix domain-containing protein [Caballeronia sp. PC1]
MSRPPVTLPPRYLRTPEAARFLGLSGRTLEKHRYFGSGPAYRRIGGRVVYSVDDLRAWADLGTKYSTSDPGQNDLMPQRDAAITQSRR